MDESRDLSRARSGIVLFRRLEPEAHANEPPSPASSGGSDLSMATSVARSGLWAVAGQVVILLATFVATPFTIRLLGPTEYGIWSLLWSVLAYFTLADLGMATASTRFAAERYATNDATGEAIVVWTAVAVTVTLTTAVALAAGLAAPLLVSQVLHVSRDLRSESVLALRLICVAAVAYAAGNVVNTPQQVRLRWRSLTFTSSGPVVVQVAAAPVVLAATAGGIVAMTVIVATAATVAAVLNFAVAIRLQPELRRPSAAPDVLRRTVKYGGWLAIAGFAGIPLRTAERFLLAYFHSPTQVAYYTVAASVGSLLAVIPAAVSQPMLASLTRLASQGRRAENRRLYHQALRGVFLLTTPAALMLAFVARPLLALWAGPVYSAHSVVAFYFILTGLWINTLAYTPFYQLLASDRAATIAILHLAELVPYLVVATALTSAFGVVGAAVAWTLRVAADAVALFVVTRRGQGLPWVPTPQRSRAFLIGIVCLGGSLWGLSVVTSSLAGRMAWCLVILIFYSVGEWKIVLTPGERRGLATLLGAIFSRRHPANASAHS
jgi:O-antigen/teichoic acid export membrane protein